jgi:UDP-3-O-acyl-N-acetylglucosamine deacetylase
VCTALRGGSLRVLGPEALLAALEGCGVDNARIEIEGGEEVPVIDGSAQGWALEVQKAGLVEASGGEGRSSRRAPAPQEMLTVREGDAFISFYPGPSPRVTAGVDHAAAVIGRQWFTWGPDAGGAVDRHFRWEVARARVVLPSVAAAHALLAAGLLQAGPEMCCLVADGQDWVDPLLVTYPGQGDETARAAALQLLGNLALAAPPGGRGLPEGHVVAYRAGPELQLRFAAALAAKAGEWEYAPAAV